MYNRIFISFIYICISDLETQEIYELFNELKTSINMFSIKLKMQFSSWYTTSFSNNDFKKWCFWSMFIPQVVLRQSVAPHQLLQSNNLLPNI